MGRAKLKMELLTTEKTRHTMYQKRKQGMIKKANELAVLCDVETVVIVYPPNSNEPEIWPENPSQIKNAIASFKAKKTENGTKTYGLNDFFEERKKKIEEELVKTRKRNMEAKYPTWFDDFDGLSEVQLRDFAMGLENKENAVSDFLEFQKRSRFMQYPSLDQVHNHGVGWFDGAPTTSFVPVNREVGGYGYPVYGNFNSWQFQPPVVQGGGMMPEVGMNAGGFDGGVDYVMQDHRGRFLGQFQPPVAMNVGGFDGGVDYVMEDHRRRFLG